VASVEIPRVTSAVEARQEGQVLEGLGAMGVAQRQQRIVLVVPWVMAGAALAISMVGGWLELEWGVSLFFCVAESSRKWILMVNVLFCKNEWFT
jgi:hypothetical protein